MTILLDLVKEKWSAAGNELRRIGVLGLPVRLSKFGADDELRLKLAAQAPAMALLLLSMRRHSYVVEGKNGHSCPGCGKAGGENVEDHFSTCRLMTVLRDAGALP